MADFFPAVLGFRLVSCGCGVALSLEELNPRWRSSMSCGLRLKVSGFGFRVESSLGLASFSLSDLVISPALQSAQP